ncbi:hypothetical protein [Labrys neptuniae]
MDHIERGHVIVLAGAIDEVFPLFTPIGEALWMEGWNPEFLHPENGETRQGMLFRTNHGDEETLWACVTWDPSAHHIRYLRVTPGSRMGFVDVTCREDAAGHTRATVAYVLTALADKGRSRLADLTEAAFTEMIDGWQMRIDRWLRRGRPLQGNPQA